MTSRLTLYTYGQPVAVVPQMLSTIADTSADLDTSTVTPPTVSFDTTATILRTGSLSIVDPTGEFIPEIAGSTELLPAGNELLIETTDPAGEWVPLGLLGITGTVVSDSVDSSSSGDVVGEVGPVVTVSLQDRAFVIGQSAPTSTVQFPNGTPVEVATYQLLSAACPWIPAECWQFQQTGATLPAQTVDAGANPFTTALAWWTAIGGVLYPDTSGNIVGVTNPVGPNIYADYAYGGGVLTGVSPEWDATQAYNGVTVVTANPGVVAAQATAWDTDPSSLTYYLGPFGQRPAPPVTAETSLTAAQCLSAAIGLLPQYLGLTRTLTTTILPDPHLEPYTLAVCASAKDGAAGLWQAQSGTYTLDNSSSQTVTWVPAGQPVNWGQTA